MPRYRGMPRYPGIPMTVAAQVAKSTARNLFGWVSMRASRGPIAPPHQACFSKAGRSSGASGPREAHADAQLSRFVFSTSSEIAVMIFSPLMFENPGLGLKHKTGVNNFARSHGSSGVYMFWAIPPGPRTYRTTNRRQLRDQPETKH